MRRALILLAAVSAVAAVGLAVFGVEAATAALRPVPFTNPDGSDGVDLYLDPDLFPEAFAAESTPRQPG